MRNQQGICLLAVVTLVGFFQCRKTPAAESLADWKFSREVLFNTSATGANVARDVADFPVAVAMSASSFDFALARPDGADIRFTAVKDGAPLPHSVEHWSRDDRVALVWVKVDVVRGNSASQSIVMHWGNAAAMDAGNSAAVFDTKNGFVGVWHLAEDGNTREGGYVDATANSAHATGVNLKAESRAAGVLGPAVALRHADKQWIKIDGEKRKLFDLTDRLTFSVWAWADSYANRGDEARRALPGYETMIAKGDNSWRLQKFGVRDWHKPPAELVEICVERAPRGDLCVVGKTDMVTGKWFHMVGVQDHPQAKLYVNGVLDKVETFDVPWSSGDHSVGIGNQSQFPQQGRSWDGRIDECRFMSVAKDDHWIKLDYESQKPGQRFLTFGPVRSIR